MGDIADDAYMHEYEGEFEELPQPPAPDAADSGEKVCKCVPMNDELMYTGNCPIHGAEATRKITMENLQRSSNPEAKQVLDLIAAAVQAAQVELRESTYDALIRVANLHGPIPASNLELLKKAALLDGERRKEGGKDAGD